MVLDDKSGQQNEVELKVITTRICQSTEVLNGEQDYVTFKKGSLVFPCGGGTGLEVKSYKTCLIFRSVLIQRENVDMLSIWCSAYSGT